MPLSRSALVRLTSNPSRDPQRQETRPPHRPSAPSNRQRKGPPLPVFHVGRASSHWRSLAEPAPPKNQVVDLGERKTPGRPVRGTPPVPRHEES